MFKIVLTDDVFIEVDNLNATLKQIRTGKKGKPFESIQGYFAPSALSKAIERAVRLVTADKMEGLSISLNEYISCLNKVSTDVSERAAVVIEKCGRAYTIKEI